MYNALLRGPGVHLPDQELTNQNIVGLRNHKGDGPLIKTSIEDIVGLCGVHNRRFSVDKDVIEMGRLAVEDLFARLDYDREKIQEVRFATNWHIMGEEFPAHAAFALTGLETFAMSDISAGCSGLGYAIRDASNSVMVGEKEAVLVIGSERLLHYTDMSDRGTCILFGDAATAFIVERSPYGGIIVNETGGKPDRNKYLRSREKLGHQLALAEDGSYTTVEKVMKYLEMDGRRVMKYASQIMPFAIRQGAKKVGLPVSRINVVIPHGANLRIVDYSEKMLREGIDPEQEDKLPKDERFDGTMYTNLANFGNTSTASIGVAFRQAVDEGFIKEGDIVAMPTFGAGFTWAVNILEYRG